MLIIESPNHTYTVTLQGDYVSDEREEVYYVNVYKRNQTTMRIKREGPNPGVTVFVVAIAEVGFSSRYYSDPNGELVIDLHPFLFKAPGQNFSVELHCIINGIISDRLLIVATVKEGVGYKEMMAPVNKDWDYWMARGRDVILPPSVMLAPEYFPPTPTFLEGFGVFAESNYHDIDGDASWSVMDGASETAATLQGCQIRIPVTADFLKLTTGKGQDVFRTWKFAKTDQCADLVVCRWTSLTGVVRQHFFPVASYIKGNGRQLSLVSSGNAQEGAKENVQAIRCRLDGLTSYDYWYYMDILQATDLHAILRPTMSQFRTEIASPMTSALITSEGGETPSGNGFHSFEFVINLKKYSLC